MADYSGLFSSKHSLDYFLIEPEGLYEVLIDKDTVTYVSEYFTFWLRKVCEFDEVDIDNHIGSYHESCTLFHDKEFAGNYSIYIQTLGNKDRNESDYTITSLINFLLKKTEGDFTFALTVGVDIIIRTNNKIYLNNNYGEYDLLQFNEIEDIDLYLTDKISV